MGNTRPLPQPWAPLGERLRSAAASRRVRRLRRAAVVLAVLVVLLVLVASVLWIVTPPASEAVKLAREQAGQHGISYPGPAAPANFARPLIATEDHRFYSEPGIDIFAVARVIKGKLTGAPDQGGATLEQQLAKMLYTPGQSGFASEVEQVTLAFKLNFAYSKQQILNLYAEAAYYGQGYYGLEQASCGYFGHPARDLTVNQGAMLAGIVNAPSLDDPVTDPANARARLVHVLTRMVAVGYLTKPQAKAALRTPLDIVPRSRASCQGR